jgi:hypothetical protein
MTQTMQASSLHLTDLETTIQLEEVQDLAFFQEWQGEDFDFSAWEKESLDRLKAGYFNLLKQPPLLENAVLTVILYHILFIAGFYLAPLNCTMS